MELSQVKTGHNIVIIDPIYVPPKKGHGIISPTTGLEMGGKGSYDDHPFQALVIVAPEFFYYGDTRYKSEIQAGDVIILPGKINAAEEDTGFINPDRAGMVVIQSIEYLTLRYSEVQSYYRPTEEQRKKFKFYRLMDATIRN